MKKTVINSLSVVMLCLFSVVSFAQTNGTFTITYNQPQPTSPSGVKNVYAIWIENAAGTFIKTKARYVSTSTDDHLPSWGAKAGCANAAAVAASGNNCSVTDALTGATRTASTSPTAYGAKSMTWDGKNVVGTTNGTTVADGVYKIWIESSWVDSGSNNHQVVTSFSFTKGPTAQHLTPASTSTYFNTVVLDWVPTALGINDLVSKEPAVVIYPVPSSGVFNIDLKNEVQDIKVFNLLGQTVYSQKFDSNNATTTKQIDLSNLTDGNYIFSLTNENGTSNYEVILKK